jgi:hypothetical protein
VAALAESSNAQLAPGSRSAKQIHVILWINETVRRKYCMEADAA